MKNMKKWIVLQLVLCSCAGVTRHNQPGNSSSNSSSNQPVDQKNHNGVGPNLNQQPNASANVPLANPGATIVTAPNPAHRPKIAIILSPGGMRAMAHVGVLRSLQRYQIPVDQVVGYEWGAIVGGLFSSSAKANDVEWKLMRLKDSDFSSKGVFSSSRPASPDTLNDFLQSTFAKQMIETARIPFYCPALQLNSGRTEYLHTGAYAETLKKCVGLAPLFSAKEGWLADVWEPAQTISFLRSQGFDLIIFVNLLGRNAFYNSNDDAVNLLWSKAQQQWLQASRGADWVIDVPTYAYPLHQLMQRKQLIQEGEQSADKIAKLIAEKYGF